MEVAGTSAAPDPATTGYAFSDAVSPANSDPATGGYSFAAAKGDGSAAGPPPKTTGFIPNIWAGVQEGAAALNQISEASPAQMIMHGLGLGGPSMSERLLANKNVANVEPADVTEGAARAATRGAVSMLGQYGVGRAIPEAAALTMGSPVRAAAVGAAGSLGGAALSDWVPDQYKDVANTAGQFLFSGGALGAEAAARGSYRGLMAGGRALAGAANVGDAAPVVDPATGQPFLKPGTNEPYVGTDQQQGMAARAIAQAAGTTTDDMAANTPVGPWGGNMPTATGAQLTMGQDSGDLGVLGLERRLRNQPAGREQFLQQEASNTLARVANMDRVTPDVASDAASQFVMSRLRAMQAEEEANQIGAQGDASAALDAAGAGPGLATTEASGGQQRTTLEGLRQPAKDAASAALEAIDPDKDLAVDASPVGDKARDIRINDVGEAETQHPSAAKVLDVASGINGVITFQRLRQLLSSTTTAMRQIAKNPEYGRESPSYRRMGQVVSSIHDSMAAAAGRQAAADAAGTQAPSEGIVGRLSESNASGTEPASGGGVGATVAGESGAAGSAGAAFGGGTAPEGQGAAGSAGQGNVAGDSGVAPPATAGQPGGGKGAAPAETPIGGGRERRSETLLQWLTARGGLKSTPDLQAIGADTYHHRGGGRLLNPKGGAADKAHVAAMEEGFFRPDSDVTDFHDAIRDELHGHPRYRLGEQAAGEYQAHLDEIGRREDQRREQADWDVQNAEFDHGVRLSDKAREHATQLLLDDDKMHAHEALRQALHEDEETGLDINAKRNAFGQPGMPLAEQPAMELPGGPKPLREYMPPQSRADYVAANQNYAAYKARFREGAVGDVLRPGATTPFKISDVQVPGKLWQRGAAGADAADSLIRAAGSREAALRILGDTPALSFRNYAAPDGIVNPAAAERWMRVHAEVLNKFPEIRAGFATAADAQRTVQQAAINGTQRIEAYQDSAAKYYLGKGNPEGVHPITAIDKLMGDENSPAAARQLMADVGSDQAAADGVRRNTIQWFMGKVRAASEAGTSGESDIANAAVQRIMNNPKTMGALRAILTPEQMRAMTDTATDLRQAARAWNGIKIPGSPATAADAEALGHGKQGTLFGQIWLAEKIAHLSSALLGDYLGLVGEGLLVVGGKMFAARRAAGLENVNDLMVGGVLNPAMRRVLAQKAIANPSAPIVRDMARKMVAAAAGIHQTHGIGQ